MLPSFFLTENACGDHGSLSGESSTHHQLLTLHRKGFLRNIRQSSAQALDATRGVTDSSIEDMCEETTELALEGNSQKNDAPSDTFFAIYG